MLITHCVGTRLVSTSSGALCVWHRPVTGLEECEVIGDDLVVIKRKVIGQSIVEKDLGVLRVIGGLQMARPFGDVNDADRVAPPVPRRLAVHVKQLSKHHVQRRLFMGLSDRGLLQRLALVHETTGDGPPVRLVPPLDKDYSIAVLDDNIDGKYGRDRSSHDGLPNIRPGAGRSNRNLPQNVEKAGTGNGPLPALTDYFVLVPPYFSRNCLFTSRFRIFPA